MSEATPDKATVMDESFSERALAAQRLRPDIDLSDQKLGMKVAAERLSTVRYVFLVQIEDGIASASQRASLEYADAVLIEWPDEHSPEIVALDEGQLATVRELSLIHI